MARARGLDPSQFVVADRASARFLDFLQYLHPMLLQTMSRRRQLHLRLIDDGNCCFLGPQGCRLPGEARPLYCLLMHPLFVSPHDRLMVLVSGGPGPAARRTLLAKKDETPEPGRGHCTGAIQPAATNSGGT
ncbi:hypothetical protein DFAR_850011 [Desulfarculales bacterium]